MRVGRSGLRRRLRRFLGRDSRWRCVRRLDNVRGRNRSRQLGDGFLLRAQFQMQIEHHRQADADPQIEDQVDAAADPDKFGHQRAVRRHPDEIKPGEARHDR